MASFATLSIVFTHFLFRAIPSSSSSFFTHPQWGTADAEIEDPSVENPELKVLPSKPGAGPYIGKHATPTTREPSVERRTQSSKIPRFKPGAGPCIAMHATPTARDFSLANFYPSDPFTCILFSKTRPEFYPWWPWPKSILVWACKIKYATLLVVTDN